MKNIPLRIAACEDSPSDSEALRTMLLHSSISNVCTLFSSGEDLLSTYQPGTYDLVLSDIYMTGITGVETITRLREKDPSVPVAFVTSSSEFALEGYRLNVLKYIEKPYNSKDIDAILKLALMKKNNAPAFQILINGKYERIAYKDIVYFEQQTHQLYIHLTDGQVVQIYEKLSACMGLLEENGFFSPHKSYAVNLNFIIGIDSELRCFVLQTGQNIPIRRESMAKARQILKNHMFRLA